MIGTWPTGWGEQQWADAARRLGTERTGMAVRQHWQLKLQAPYGAEPDGPPPDEPPPRSRLAGSEPRLPPPLVLEPGASSLADGKDARLPWTELERSALQQACTAAGWAPYDPSDAAKRRDWAPDWKSIATAVGSRTPKQCRERWENYADPMIDPSPLTPTEENLLLQLVEEKGAKWADVAAQMWTRKGEHDRLRAP